MAGSSRPAWLGGEILVRDAHGRRAVADRGGDPLDRAVPDVSGCEDARDGGLERERHTVKRPSGRMGAVPVDVVGFSAATHSTTRSVSDSAAPQDHESPLAATAARWFVRSR